MHLWRPMGYDVGASLDAWIASLPDRPGVYSLHTPGGSIYAGRTAAMGRRLKRLLGLAGGASRMLNLRNVTARVEWQFAGSRLETCLMFYDVMRRVHAATYREAMRLKPMSFIKLNLINNYPRCCISSRFSAARGFWYGPFRSRSTAEQFLRQLQELFQVRRCVEDLSPSADHPGCVYGEMNLCLRPCQQVVGVQEYASEVDRLVEFLASGGRTAVATVTRERDRLCEDLRFEEARGLHRQLDKIAQVVRARDELACDAFRLSGVAVTRSVEEGAVNLWFVLDGGWLAPVPFRVEASGDRSVSLDERLREIASGLRPAALTLREREDHLALLARWYYSTFRDGEWLPFERVETLPYRKLVRAISRVASGEINSSPGGTKALPSSPGAAPEIP